MTVELTVELLPPALNCWGYRSAMPLLPREVSLSVLHLLCLEWWTFAWILDKFWLSGNFFLFHPFSRGIAECLSRGAEVPSIPQVSRSDVVPWYASYVSHLTHGLPSTPLKLAEIFNHFEHRTEACLGEVQRLSNEPRPSEAKNSLCRHSHSNLKCSDKSLG